MILTKLKNYNNKIAPFIRNGVIIDTSVIEEIIEGLVLIRRNSADKSKIAEYKKIVDLLDLLKLSNKWDMFFLTPHIMTETCTHINLSHNKKTDFGDVVDNFMSVIKPTTEKSPNKENCLNCYKKGNKLEIGDLSIYSLADSFAKEKKKVAILSKDDGFSVRYSESPYVMVIDYRLISDLG